MIITPTKNAKAQNLLIASILFIALMVVFSIAVNAITEKPARLIPAIEELEITSVAFSGGNTIDVVVNNFGTLDSVIAEVWINNENQIFILNPPIERIMPQSSVQVSLNYSYSNATNYTIKIVSNKGNIYLAVATTL